MSQDLLAPPKLQTRTYAKVVAAVTIFMLVAGAVLVATGMLTVSELVIRGLLITGIGLAAVWFYARLLHLAQHSRPERMPYIHAGISFMGLAGFYATASVMLWDTGFGGMTYAWMAPGLVGTTLAIGGWGRRVGESLHCPKCEYEFAFSDDEAPIRCPECATPWLGQLKKGRRIKSPRMMAAGIALALTGMVILQPIFWLGPMAKSLPTPILFAGLYVEPKSLYTSWEELATRPLAPRWVNVMADRFLRYRTRHQWDVSGSIWFEAMITSARMPADRIDRYYREGTRAKLVIPRTVRVGAPLPAKLRFTRAVEGWGSKVGVMFGGYSIDGAPPIGRAPDAAWGYQLRPQVFTRHRDLFQQSLSLPTPGTHTIRATYWVIYQPSFWAITWGPEGEPIKPAAALWFERIDVESTVNVR